MDAARFCDLTKGVVRVCHAFQRVKTSGLTCGNTQNTLFGSSLVLPMSSMTVLVLFSVYSLQVWALLLGAVD